MLTLRKKRKNRKGTWAAVRVISNILNTETIPTIFGKEKGRDRGNEAKNLYTEYKFVRSNTVGRSRERERETRWKFNRRGERKRKKRLKFKIYYTSNILELDKSVRNYSDGRENSGYRISVMFFTNTVGHGSIPLPSLPRSRIRSAPLTF